MGICYKHCLSAKQFKECKSLFNTHRLHKVCTRVHCCYNMLHTVPLSGLRALDTPVSRRDKYNVNSIGRK